MNPHLGFLGSGGTNLRIRQWDYKRSCSGVQVVQETRRRPLTTKLTTETVLAAAATDSAGCHRDSILSLASVELNQRLLILSSSDGAVKVWK